MEKLLQTNLEETPYQAVWLSGGVAANMALRKALRHSLKHISRLQTGNPLPLLTPYTKKLCGDNAAMIGLLTQ
jgi:tRNA A37 threonylcarbamoyltransferase TsaD